MKIFIFGGYLLMPNIDSKELAGLFKKLKEENYIIILDIAVTSNQQGLSEKIKDVLPYVDYFFQMTMNQLKSLILKNLKIKQNALWTGA